MSTFLPLPKMNLVAAGLAVFIAIHAYQNTKLSRNGRKYFALMMLLPSVSILIECIYSRLSVGHLREFVDVFTLVVMCMDCFIPLLLFKACDITSKKMHICALVLAGIHTIGEIIMYPSHLVYYVSDDGIFKYGPAGWFFAGCCILSILLTIHILIRLGKRFNHQKIEYPIASVILLIAGTVADQYDLTAGASYLLQVWGLMLEYVYYSDLCTIELVNNLENSRDQLAMTLAEAIDAKDKYTNGHSYRVASYSGILAKELGWDKEAVKDIERQALLHDIGKIGVPDSVLNKAGKLDDVEFEIIKSHTKMGGNIISHAISAQNAFAACRYHHEKYDGTGYPEGLKGENIPIVARIVAIADAYDAMNSDRIYRKALSKEVIRQNLLNGSGSQFDPKLLKVFIKLLDEDKLNLSDTYMGKALNGDSYFENEAKDLFEAFEIKKEYQNTWDDDYSKFEQLNKYFEKIKDKDESDFCMAYIDIMPKEENEASLKLLDDAIDTLSGVIDVSTSDSSFCQRVSLHQLAIVLMGKDSENASDTMLNIMLYFYKIFETQAFNISYGVLDRNPAATADK